MQSADICLQRLTYQEVYIIILELLCIYYMWGSLMMRRYIVVLYDYDYNQLDPVVDKFKLILHKTQLPVKEREEKSRISIISASPF